MLSDRKMETVFIEGIVRGIKDKTMLVYLTEQDESLWIPKQAIVDAIDYEVGEYEVDLEVHTWYVRSIGL